MRPTKPRSWFTRLAQRTSHITGRPGVFMSACAIVLIWAITGPVFGFSDTWQLIINTGTTIVTFLMVFLIQSTQNRDSEAIQVKLDELIRVARGAHVALLDLEKLEDEELDAILEQYQELAQKARERLRKGKSDTDIMRLPPQKLSEHPSETD